MVYDTRVLKTLRSLSKKYAVLALGWDRNRLYNKDKLCNELIWKGNSATRPVIKILHVNAPFNQDSLASYLPLIVYFPVFWVWTFLNLAKARPKIVHACDLDTLPPCYLYKIFFRKKVVFDVYDRYAMTLIPARFKTLHSIVNLVEEFFSKRSDVLINISEEVLRTFKNKPKKSILIMNSPEDVVVNKSRSKQDDVLSIVYTGAVWKDTRGLENIIQATKGISNIEFLLAGWYREQDKKFLDEISQIPYVKFKGLLQPKESLELEASSDVLIALYDPNLPLYHVTLPNKLFEAMMCGIPLITNVASRMVNEVGFGIIVQYDDITGIREAILTLKESPSLRQKLGLSGRKAYLEKYSWSKMEQELFKTYATLLE